MLGPTATSGEYDQAKRSADAVMTMLGALVEAKQRRPGDDLVSALVDARDGQERLTHQELLSTIFQLMVAGHDTTTSLIGNGVVSLLRHPKQLALVRAEPSRIPGALDELLRYDAPVPHSTFRYSLMPLTIGGIAIPASAQVIISLASANRDSRRFAHAEDLDFDRPDARNLAFGHGIHFCLGAALARMEGHVALASLLNRFPQIRLATAGSELHWGHGDGLVLRGLLQLPVIPGPARRATLDRGHSRGGKAWTRPSIRSIASASRGLQRKPDPNLPNT